MQNTYYKITNIIIIIATILFIASCTPTIKVQPPENPITINLDIKLKHDIQIKVEKDVDELIRKNKVIFE